mmetsp:Transcript_67659/g.78562  ORF Transcript_67659/g.78562 Transcript_67659/m.78562 type:complete len:118 (+) Transcript_67659:45-398(+)
MNSLVKPVSVTEFIPSRRYDNLQGHPVQRIQENKWAAEEEVRMQGYSTAFGSHLPMKLTIERTIASQTGRLPGLKSSNLQLDIAMNRLNRIDFEDFLNIESELPERETPQMKLLKEL